MTVSFESIPNTIRVPGQYIEIVPVQAATGLFSLPTSILVIGQMLPTGTMAVDIPVQVTSAAQAVAQAGPGSMLAQMAADALTGCQGLIPVWIAAVADNAAGVKASGTATIGGLATGAGTLALYVGGRMVTTAVNAGDSAATIATNLGAAIGATADMPVTANAAGPVVTLTAVHKGLCGNDIDLRLNYNTGDATPAGLTVTLVPMAGGTANPLIAPVLDGIGDLWFTDIAMPWTDAVNLTALETWLATGYGPLAMRDGMAWAAVRGSYGTVAALGQARNSPHDTIMGVPPSPSLPWEWAATLAGVAAYFLSIDPARPLQTLPLPGLMAPAVANRFTWDERNLLLGDGISTFDVDRSGAVSIERCVTTYQTGAFGVPDSSYMNVETLRTVATLRFDARTYIAQMFPRFKLADDGTVYPTAQAIVTPKMLAAALIARFGVWQDAGLVEDMPAFAAGLVVQRNASDRNRVDVVMPVKIVGQLRVTAAQLAFSE